MIDLVVGVVEAFVLAGIAGVLHLVASGIIPGMSGMGTSSPGP